MKTIRGRLVVAVAVVAGLLQVACKGQGGARSGDSASGAVGTPAAGSGTAAGSTAATTPVAAPPVSSGADSALGDAGLLAAASAGDSAEIALSSYVRQQTTNAGVKSYATTLERDHAKGVSKVEQTAKTLNLVMRLSTSDTTTQGTAHELDRLKSLKGHDLDTAFVNHEIADHQHDIEEAKQMEAQAKASQVKALFKDEMPELERHLAAGKKLSQTLGTGARK